MPITPEHPLRVLDQGEFSDIAYEVVGHAFAIHREMGRFFDEHVYRNALADRLGQRAKREFTIRIEFGGFVKLLRIDLVVDGGAAFETKTARQLAEPHRTQLIQYLMLTELRHGKLLNFRPEQMQHEFVNCSTTTSDRHVFQVCHAGWNSQADLNREFQDGALALLNDWGTGLDVQLYEEAIAHQFSRVIHIDREIEVIRDGKRVGTHRVRLIEPQTAFKVTTLSRDLETYEDNLKKLIQHTELKRIFWLNATRKIVQLTEVSMTP